MEEQWKDIPEYEGFYQASNLGRVRSLDREVKAIDGKIRNCKGRLLVCNINGRGYKLVQLSKNNIFKTKLVHKLIAIVFLNHTPDGMNVVVDHIDNNPLNNNSNNLQLITSRKNSSKDKVNKSSKYTGVIWNKRHNKWQSAISIKTHSIYLGLFNDEVEAANTYQCALANKDLVFRNKDRQARYRFYTDKLQPKLNDYVRI